MKVAQQQQQEDNTSIMEQFLAMLMGIFIKLTETLGRLTSRPQSFGERNRDFSSRVESDTVRSGQDIEEIQAQIQVHKEKIGVLEQRLLQVPTSSEQSDQSKEESCDAASASNEHFTEQIENLSAKLKETSMELGKSAERERSLQENVKYPQSQNENLQKENLSKDEKLEKLKFESSRLSSELAELKAKLGECDCAEAQKQELKKKRVRPVRKQVESTQMSLLEKREVITNQLSPSKTSNWMSRGTLKLTIYNVEKKEERLPWEKIEAILGRIVEKYNGDMKYKPIIFKIHWFLASRMLRVYETSSSTYKYSSTIKKSMYFSYSNHIGGDDDKFEYTHGLEGWYRGYYCIMDFNVSAEPTIRKTKGMIFRHDGIGTIHDGNRDSSRRKRHWHDGKGIGSTEKGLARPKMGKSFKI